MAAEGPRLPRSVQITYLRPLRRTALYDIPSCDLQLRSYSVRNLDLMTDFAMRAAYFLGLPASGPVPLPRIIERWTVSKSNFVHKKNKENFERITSRRLIQLKDAPTNNVEIWLAFLRKHVYHGVGLKANVWEHEKLGKLFKSKREGLLSSQLTRSGVGNEMDGRIADLKPSLDSTWDQFGRRSNPHSVDEIINLLQDNATSSI